MNMDCPGHVASDSLGKPGDIEKNRKWSLLCNAIYRL